MGCEVEGTVWEVSSIAMRLDLSAGRVNVR